VPVSNPVEDPQKDEDDAVKRRREEIIRKGGQK
jgi:hypothetical protein